MYRIKLNHIKDKYDFNELIKIFLPPGEYETLAGEELRCERDESSDSEARTETHGEVKTIEINENGLCDKNAVKRELYKKLSSSTGKNPPWGILTGVRPVKLAGEIFRKEKDLSEAEALLKTEETLKGEYLLSGIKARLLTDIYKYQQDKLDRASGKTAGVYIGIPFCPTRCLYCSFTSNQKGREDIEAYLKALFKEMEYCGRAMKDGGITAETVYIGGGTPTTLDAEQLDLLLAKVKECFDLSRLKEFTVEAGRPDTITKEKLKTVKRHGIERISINPQTMKDETLKLIGRDHSAQEIRKAFKIAEDCGGFTINADLIAGLPGESPGDFERSLREVISLDPANITVHTLAVKKASKLIEADEDFHYKQAGAVEEMLKISSAVLKEAGYRPYYLYRQKHMAGALENVGYCKGDSLCVYNVRIMDESQSILALGAGGISKKYYPAENRLERVPNVSNYQVYIERTDEMIDRKRKNFFLKEV